MNNINAVLEKKNSCFGCRACFNICPFHAINMKEDEEGFSYPDVNSELCTSCGLCKNVCPALSKSSVFSDNSNDPDCYAAMGNDEIRAVSSSGGVFSLLAEKIFAMGGVVCGAAYVGQNVKHIIIDKPSELYLLRGVKYLQSDTGTIFSQIRDILKSGRILLFSGTPCQVAGLNLFLGIKFDNLYTVDLVCHGVPSQKIFDKYLEETMTEKDKGDFYHTSFRDKIAGWGVYKTTTTTTTGFKYYGSPTEQDSFIQAFIRNMCLRPSCGTCSFTSCQREADITIGDFWAIERFKKELNDNKGTSLILVNNPKGQKLFEAISDKFITLEKVPIEYAKYYNISLYRTLPQHTNRKGFFRTLNSTGSLQKAVEYCNQYKYDVGILNFWNFPNMGGILQAWALQNMISSSGYSSVLYNIQEQNDNLNSENFIWRFARNNLTYSSIITSANQLAEFTENINSVVLGSDCIWANWWGEDDNKQIIIFLGNFCNSRNKIISYAPSFGNSRITDSHSNKQIRFMQYYLNRMDHISVREKSGVDILKTNFNIEGTQVLDPTLCLDIDKYDELIKNSKYSKSGYILNYSIGIRENDLAYRELLKKIENEEIFTLTQNTLDETDVEDWLYLIRNSKLLITNSYHACCFAIKFNVPFYIFSPYGLDTSRFDSLLGILHLENRIIRSKEDVYKIENIYNPVDWNKINSVIKKEAERSVQWLKKALESPKDFSKINPADDLISYLNSRITRLESEINKDESYIYLNLLDYKKNYNRYMMYRILKKLSSSPEKKQQYKAKQEFYYDRLKSAKSTRIKNNMKSTILLEDIIAVLKKLLKRSKKL